MIFKDFCGVQSVLQLHKTGVSDCLTALSGICVFVDIRWYSRIVLMPKKYYLMEVKELNSKHSEIECNVQKDITKYYQNMAQQ